LSSIPRQGARIEEKPANPNRITRYRALYFYDNDVLDIAAPQPPARGELRSLDVNRGYLERRNLGEPGRPWICLSRTGTHESLLQAALFIERSRASMAEGACPEEIAFATLVSDRDQLERLAGPLARADTDVPALNRARTV